MALPILNDTPKYELTIPSSNKTVRFRPYLVKEEKILLMANESKRSKHHCVGDDRYGARLSTG